MSFDKTKSKQIIVNNEKIRSIVLETIQNMADIVGKTLGPSGNPVIIERDGLSPLVTKDGVTVAKALGVSDASANIIIEAAKEICLNTAREAGDGTTSAIVLAAALVKYGQEFLVANPKYNPQKMVAELNHAYNLVVVPYLKQNAVEVKTEDQLLSVATISANGDVEIAEAVVKAVMAAGDDGHVLITEGQGRLTTVETLDGYVVTTGLKDLGQIGPLFINDRANQQVRLDEGYVVLYDGSLNDLKVPSAIQSAIELQPGSGAHDGTPMIVFAHDFSDVVKDAFAKQTKSGLSIIPIKTPRSGLPNGASMFLQDMAAYTSGTVYDASNLGEMDEEDFGKFKTAKINLYEAFIIGTPDSDAISERVIELKAISDSAFGEMDKGLLRAAIAKLTGGVSTIYIGGNSDLEIREKKGRVEDAVEAVRSAIAEGIVPGGCSVHLTLANILFSHPDAKPSWQILYKALHEPFRLLLSNCGEDYDEVMQFLDSYRDASEFALPNRIFDADLHQISNPFDVGIIEPAKVVRVSISNALSVASLLIRLGGIVVVPRDAGMEGQLELASNAFKQMMEAENNNQ